MRGSDFGDRDVGVRVKGESAGGLRARIQGDLTVMYELVANAKEGRPRLAMVVATVRFGTNLRECPGVLTRGTQMPQMPHTFRAYN